MIGYQIKYWGYGHPEILQSLIFQDRIISGNGGSSIWFQGQDDRRWNDFDYNPPLNDRDLPLDTWIDFNLVIYNPNHFPSSWQQMGDFPWVPDFWYVLHDGGSYYYPWVEEDYERQIIFHEDGTFEIE